MSSLEYRTLVTMPVHQAFDPAPRWGPPQLVELPSGTHVVYEINHRPAVLIVHTKMPASIYARFAPAFSLGRAHFPAGDAAIVSRPVAIGHPNHKPSWAQSRTFILQAWGLPLHTNLVLSYYALSAHQLVSNDLEWQLYLQAGLPPVMVTVPLPLELPANPAPAAYAAAYPAAAPQTIPELNAEAGLDPPRAATGARDARRPSPLTQVTRGFERPILTVSSLPPTVNEGLPPVKTEATGTKGKKACVKDEDEVQAGNAAQHDGGESAPLAKTQQVNAWSQPADSEKAPAGPHTEIKDRPNKSNRVRPPEPSSPLCKSAALFSLNPAVKSAGGPASSPPPGTGEELFKDIFPKLNAPNTVLQPTSLAVDSKPAPGFANDAAPKPTSSSLAGDSKLAFGPFSGAATKPNPSATGSKPAFDPLNDAAPEPPPMTTGSLFAYGPAIAAALKPDPSGGFKPVFGVANDAAPKPASSSSAGGSKPTMSPLSNTTPKPNLFATGSKPAFGPPSVPATTPISSGLGLWTWGYAKGTTSKPTPPAAGSQLAWGSANEAASRLTPSAANTKFAFGPANAADSKPTSAGGVKPPLGFANAADQKSTSSAVGSKSALGHGNDAAQKPTPSVASCTSTFGLAIDATTQPASASLAVGSTSAIGSANAADPKPTSSAVGFKPTSGLANDAAPKPTSAVFGSTSTFGLAKDTTPKPTSSAVGSQPAFSFANYVFSKPVPFGTSSNSALGSANAANPKPSADSPRPSFSNFAEPRVDLSKSTAGLKASTGQSAELKDKANEPSKLLGAFAGPSNAGALPAASTSVPKKDSPGAKPAPASGQETDPLGAKPAPASGPGKDPLGAKPAPVSDPSAKETSASSSPTPAWSAKSSVGKGDNPEDKSEESRPSLG